MDKYSQIGNSEIISIEELYNQYLLSSENVDESWQRFFKGFDFAQENYLIKPSLNIQNSNFELIEKEFKVIELIEAYRSRGHLFTDTNPVHVRRKYFPTLDIENFELNQNDLNTEFQAGKQIGIGKSKLKDIILHLNETYCKSIGVEYLYIRQPLIIEWLQKKMESSKNKIEFSKETKKQIYHSLVQSVGFENFLHKKFVGQKRFSLEGAESLIPALNVAINKGSELGIEEFIIGMPHRGRLNVLANILEKPLENVFAEFFTKQYDETISLGDVKYHLGYGNTVKTISGKSVKVNLAPNPSHLETVGGIIQGITRAKIDKYNQKPITGTFNNFNKVAPIIIHGDAAIAGQGIVYEIIQMSQLEGYKTGGTIHLVINNQVGFTTNYIDARSSTYCTDIAKVTLSPVFHVNGDDVEALVYTMGLAMEFRQRFNSDVFIDILCYRKYGHNEGDEPRFTQPLLYNEIAKHPNIRQIYFDKLVSSEIFKKDELEFIDREFEQLLDNKLALAKTFEKLSIPQFLIEEWGNFIHPENEDFRININTSVSLEKLVEIAKKINTLPSGKNFFKKIEKLVEDRMKMIDEGKIDWSLGETLAYATLLTENHSVRISGQDSERGTFSHRHAAFVIQDSEEKYFPLKNIENNQADFQIYNSPLNEYGVLGFEYGYALSTPEHLTIWEAQFGDFHNVAQAIIDQYISSAEEKWGLMNGLVLLLPHGYEGQGPEHSSARIERFLTLCAGNNMNIVNCTTPANFFHVLRRQIKRNFRVPLIIFTPKSLLRHPKCVSPLSEFENGVFCEVIDDENVDIKRVTRIVLCSGKIYYDLLERKEKLNARDVALIRVEQLYPFPKEKILEIIKKYTKNMLTLWVQEEPENMGAFRFVKSYFPEIEPVTRIASGSPAVGLNALHIIAQEEIITKVFRKCNCNLKNDYCALQCVEGQSKAKILKLHRYL
jgi:2-oxoglutarate dehydrogenase E1 component